MIIVEGMDNSGKSTLVQQLSEDLKLCKVSTYRKPSTFLDIKRYDKWLNSCPQPLILDRHPAVSDLIYGRIIRGYSNITEEYSKLWAKNKLIIYCRPPVNQILDFKTREQMEGVKEKALKLLTFYDAYMEEIEHYVYDHTNYGEIKNVISQYI